MLLFFCFFICFYFSIFFFFFFFQAEDGIRDGHVTGVQTCALPIFSSEPAGAELLSLYGNSCLSLAKQILRYDDNSERAVELLEEASEALSTAASIAQSENEIVSDSFRLVVTLSKAGEAQLRFSHLTGSADYAKKAIASFEKARELGNTTHEILGL